MQKGFMLKQTKAPVYPERNEKVIKLLPQKVLKLTNSKTDYDPILNAMGDARVVMIGEASHGTHDYYRHRADITKRLIAEKGFKFVAVEGDWPDVYRINRYVCGAKEDSSAKEALGDFHRFPKWMWRNTVVAEFVEWLREYNQKKEMGEKVRFYGLDLYALFRSADMVIDYLNKVDPQAADVARERYGTLNRYRDNEFQYAQEVALRLAPSREKEVVSILTHMLSRGEEYLRGLGGFIDGDELLFAQLNAKVVKDAESYYRNAFAGGAVTWNIRDQHMFETLEILLEYHAKKANGVSKAAIWAHNSHLGDSRATEYARENREWNIGQLVRQNIGKDKSYNVGFTSYTGTVYAAPKWGSQGQVFDLNPAFEDSYEALFHHALPSNWLLIQRSNNKEIQPEVDLVKQLEASRTERMVGVIYCKKTERQSHYVPAVLPQQFDSVIHIDVTKALEPLDTVSAD